MTAKLGVSQRQACRALGQHRSTQRYESKQPDKDRELIEEIRTQVKHRKHRKYGYRVHYGNSTAFGLVGQSQADLPVVVHA